VTVTATLHFFVRLTKFNRPPLSQQETCTAFSRPPEAGIRFGRRPAALARTHAGIRYSRRLAALTRPEAGIRYGRRLAALTRPEAGATSETLFAPTELN
jgi:hypothetical protein